MVIYAANNDGMAIDGEGNVLPFIEGRQRLFDGTCVREFDNQEELQQYLSGVTAQWSKEAHANEINTAHDALYRELWQSKNYIGNWEVLSAAMQSDVYGDEARAILAWYWQSYAAIETYVAGVTEQTALTVENFLATLPPQP